MFAIGDLVDYRGQCSVIAGTVESILDEDFVMVREYGMEGAGRPALTRRMLVSNLSLHRHGRHCDCP